MGSPGQGQIVDAAAQPRASDAGHAACHACGSMAMMRMEGFEALPRVSSDCRPQHAGGRLAVCEACGLVQAVIDEAWQCEAAAIYERYAVYHQGGGAEQAVFAATDGVAEPRSQRLVGKLLEAVRLPAAGRVLDVGCGNGALLRALASHRPDWRLVGTELDDRDRAAVQAIPQVEAFYPTDDPTSVPGRFDLVSMIHVLEHIVDPAAFLRRVRPRLTDGGRLFIQVPYFPHNPFELLIADHSSHFTPATLAHVLRQAGLEPVVVSVDWVAKELSVVARIAPSKGRGVAEESGCEVAPHAAAADKAVQWLSQVFGQARTLAARRTFGLFGTSIAASAVAGALGDAVAFFVDEDPARIGGEHLGRPIFAPAQVPADADILIALPTPIARDVAGRLPAGPRVHLPPDLPPHRPTRLDAPRTIAHG